MGAGTYTMFTMFAPKLTECRDSPSVFGQGPMDFTAQRVALV